MTARLNGGNAVVRQANLASELSAVLLVEIDDQGTNSREATLVAFALERRRAAPPRAFRRMVLVIFGIRVIVLDRRRSFADDVDARQAA